MNAVLNVFFWVTVFVGGVTVSVLYAASWRAVAQALAELRQPGAGEAPTAPDTPADDMSRRSRAPVHS